MIRNCLHIMPAVPKLFRTATHLIVQAIGGTHPVCYHKMGVWGVNPEKKSKLLYAI